MDPTALLPDLLLPKMRRTNGEGERRRSEKSDRWNYFFFPFSLFPFDTDFFLPPSSSELLIHPAPGSSSRASQTPSSSSSRSFTFIPQFPLHQNGPVSTIFPPFLPPTSSSLAPPSPPSPFSMTAAEASRQLKDPSAVEDELFDELERDDAVALYREKRILEMKATSVPPPVPPVPAPCPDHLLLLLLGPRDWRI